MRNEKFSHSRIQTYKSCRRMYFLKYVEGIAPIEKWESLERGKNYHEKVEQIMSTGSFERDDNSKTNAMAIAFQEFILPRIFATDVEEWIELKTKSGHVFHGRIDGRCGKIYLIEHKSTAGDINEQYIARLEFDEQIKSYMLATGIRDMAYTVVKTPTIRQKKDETDEDFEQRCLEWYAEDPERRIRIINVHVDEEVLSAFAEELDETISEIKSCNLFYRNTRYCTMWGRPCEYSSICGNYDSKQDYIGFVRKERDS